MPPLPGRAYERRPHLKLVSRSYARSFAEREVQICQIGNIDSCVLRMVKPQRRFLRGAKMGQQQSLSQLIEMAKAVRMSEEQRSEQRNSFVYGNTKIENDEVTPELVEHIARKVALPAS